MSTVLDEFRVSKWRVGRKVGRTIYAMAGEAPSDEDALIGMMDTPLLAQTAVADHNGSLDRDGRNRDFTRSAKCVTLPRGMWKQFSTEWAIGSLRGSTCRGAEHRR